MRHFVTLPCWNIVSVAEVNTSIRPLMSEMWCSSPANMWTIWQQKRKRNDIWAFIDSWRDEAFIRALICGGVPAVPGPGQRLVGRRYRSVPASRSAEPPWAQSHVEGFEPICQIPHTLPVVGQVESAVSECESVNTYRLITHAQTHTASYTYIFEKKPSYLYYLWVIKPLAEDGLNQREHLL